MVLALRTEFPLQLTIDVAASISLNFCQEAIAKSTTLVHRYLLPLPTYRLAHTRRPSLIRVPYSGLLQLCAPFQMLIRALGLKTVVAVDKELPAYSGRVAVPYLHPLARHTNE